MDIYGQKQRMGHCEIYPGSLNLAQCSTRLWDALAVYNDMGSKWCRLPLRLRLLCGIEFMLQDTAGVSPALGKYTTHHARFALTRFPKAPDALVNPPEKAVAKGSLLAAALSLSCCVSLAAADDDADGTSFGVEGGR